MSMKVTHMMKRKMKLLLLLRPLAELAGLRAGSQQQQQLVAKGAEGKARARELQGMPTKQQRHQQETRQLQLHLSL
jgi:hypothetical protein